MQKITPSGSSYESTNSILRVCFALEFPEINFSDFVLFKVFQFFFKGPGFG